MAHELTLTVNGERTLLAPTVRTIHDTLMALGYADPFVAVALNRTCVRRRDFTTTTVAPGDELEILAPMAGG